MLATHMLCRNGRAAGRFGAQIKTSRLVIPAKRQPKVAALSAANLSVSCRGPLRRRCGHDRGPLRTEGGRLRERCGHSPEISLNVMRRKPTLSRIR